MTDAASGHGADGPGGVQPAVEHGGGAPPGDQAASGGAPVGTQATGGRRRRRAVRAGAGEPDPPVALRSADDSDLGWQPGVDDSNDDRLRRDVPPHW